VGGEYNLANSRVEKFLKNYMLQRVELINGTTREALQKAASADDPEAAIRHVFDVARSSRAQNIAVGEITRASNFAAVDAGRWKGQLDLKSWQSQLDSHVRMTHQELHGQVVGWLEDFTSPSGAHGPHPGALGTPDEDIGCRCFVAPTRSNARRELANGGSLQEMADALRLPFVDQLETAWRQVFAEQEAAVLAELG
jgi:hypothetical protein